MVCLYERILRCAWCVCLFVWSSPFRVRLQYQRHLWYWYGLIWCQGNSADVCVCARSFLGIIFSALVFRDACLRDGVLDEPGFSATWTMELVSSESDDTFIDCSNK